MSWMDRNVVGDVQTAIQSQTIQTAIEKNVSALSDPAFQSFLTNAPIPRCNYTAATNAPIVGNNNIQWNRAGAIDPYGMLDPTTAPTNSLFRIPVDGFYSCAWMASGAVAAAGAPNFVQLLWFTNPGAVRQATMLLTQAPGAATTYQGICPLLMPLRAGTQLFALMNNSTGGIFTFDQAFVSIVWCAPYNQYSTGSGGN